MTRTDEQGTAVEVVGVNWDVTEQVERQRQLQRNAEQLELALDAGRMGAWRYDLATGQQDWSARQYELLGLSPEVPANRETFSPRYCRRIAAWSSLALRPTPRTLP